MHIDELTRVVIGVAIRVHAGLGPGLFESVYEAVLAGKLAEMGHKVERQRHVDIEFEGVRHANAFKIDLLVGDRLIIEIKSVERSNPLFAKQLLTYLRLMKLPVGLVLNFGGSNLKDGIQRVVDGHSEGNLSAFSAPSA
ncbi:MAG: GxxExxY protein [Sphingomonadales bacterium]